MYYLCQALLVFCRTEDVGGDAKRPAHDRPHRREARVAPHAHGRLPWPTPGDLDAPARALHDRITGGPRARGPQLFPLQDPDGRLHGPFNAMLQAPALGVPLADLGAALRYGTGLDDRAREIAILAVAAARRSDFEWYAHAAVGRHVGLTDAELDALARMEAPPSLSASEELVHRTAHRLLVERDLDDAAHDEAIAVLGRSGLMELIVLVGYYDLLALSMRVWRTPLPTGAMPRFREGDAEGGDVMTEDAAR
jgi:4-carboxymuconolactone decarboxylase